MHKTNGNPTTAVTKSHHRRPTSPTPVVPRCAAIAKSGIRTGPDVTYLCSALVADIIDQRVTPSAANAVNNTVKNMIEIARMNERFGTKYNGDPHRVLVLSDYPGDYRNQHTAALPEGTTEEEEARNPREEGTTNDNV